MADHQDKTPCKRPKILEGASDSARFSNLQFLVDLENNLPDELMRGSLAEQPGALGLEPLAQGQTPAGSLLQAQEFRRQLYQQQQLNTAISSVTMHRQNNQQTVQNAPLGEQRGPAQAVPPAPSSHRAGAPAGGQAQPQATVPPHQPTGSHSVTVANVEKKNLIQQQLVLLLHADKCQKRERVCQSNGETWQCTLPHCNTMKGVLNHMMSCQLVKDCAVPHCSSSRQIISHWKHCNKNDCPVCLPLKQADRTRNNNMNAAAVSHTTTGVSTGGVGSVGGVGAVGTVGGVGNVGGVGGNAGAMPGVAHAPSAPAPASNTQMSPNTLEQARRQVSAIPAPITKEWHQSVPASLRNQLVTKLLEAIFPSQDPSAMLDARMNYLVAFARKIEVDIYEIANSRSEYYHLIGEKVYTIQETINEKRQKRREQVLREQEVLARQQRDQVQQGRDIAAIQPVVLSSTPPVSLSRQNSQRRALSSGDLESGEELAVSATDKVQKQSEQSSEEKRINSLKKQLEKVKSELESMESNRKELDGTGADAAGGSSTKQSTLTEVEELMENELQCSICAELFVAATTLNCSHTFCKYCITMWKKKKNNCPVCRTVITVECKSLVLDSFIEKMVQNLSEEMKIKRKEMLKARGELEFELARQLSVKTNSGSRGYAESDYDSDSEFFEEDEEEGQYTEA